MRLPFGKSPKTRIANKQSPLYAIKPYRSSPHFGGLRTIGFCFLYFLSKGVRVIGVKNLIAGHHRYQILGIAEIDDVVRTPLQHYTQTAQVRHPDRANPTLCSGRAELAT